MTATSIREELQAMRNSFFQTAKTTAPRPRARPASHALTRIPTTIASSCLPSTLCLQCRFLLYSAFWALRRQQDAPNRYSRDNTTALGIPRVGPDRFGRGRFFCIKNEMVGKETCHGKEKSWICQRYRLHPRRRRQRRGPRQPLGLPVQDVAKRRRRLRAHLHRVRAAHRLCHDAQRDLSRPPLAGKPHDRLQDGQQKTSAGAASWRS